MESTMPASLITKKKFDFLNSKLLLTKLIKLGLYGNMLYTIKLVLNCNLQQIFDRKFLSNEIEQNTGVAKGTNSHHFYLVFYS